MYLGFDPKKQAQIRASKLLSAGANLPGGTSRKASEERKTWKREDYEKVKKDYDDLH